MPEVSVIIPVYNAEKYLSVCLDSLRNQTLKDIEIICINDGSTDCSGEILENYCRMDPRIRIMNQKNAGAGVARNRGMKDATGRYLSFLDSDDFFEPDLFMKTVEAADRYKADFVAYRSDLYHMNTGEFEQASWMLHVEDMPSYMPFTYRELTGNIFKTFMGWAWDKLYRRSFVEQSELYFQEQRTTNDLFFVFSSLVVAKRITLVDQVFAHYRQDGTESLSVTREKSWQCFHDALIALRNLIQAKGIFWELEQDFINYALHFSLWNLRTLAEPTHTLLRRKLLDEWFDEFGISGRPQKYFYNQLEYQQYQKLLHRGDITS